MIMAVILLLSLVFFTFLGYTFHMMFHKPWSGRLYRAHLNHHFKQYPPEDFVSDKYRSAGADNTFWFFALCFSPFIIGNIILTIFGFIPTMLGVGLFIEMGVVSFINESLHTGFHLTKTFWSKFWFFKRLKRLHYQHHIDVAKNYGIFSFFWDKILHTYEKGVIYPYEE